MRSMGSIRATSAALALSAASAAARTLRTQEKSTSRSVAALRELQDLARGEGGRALLLDDLFSGLGLGGGVDCGDACSEKDECVSFLGTAPDLSVLQASCDAGCIPQVALSTCDVCGYGEEDPDATSVERLNLFDSAADLLDSAGEFFDAAADAATELVCGNCAFYECCVAEGASYDSCEDLLPDDDSGSLLGGFPDLGLGGLPDAGSLFPDLDLGDLPDAGSLLPDGFPDLGAVLPGFPGGPSTSGVGGGASAGGGMPAEGGAVPGGIVAPGLSVLSRLVDGLECPCLDDGLCDSVFAGRADRFVLEDACESGCLPVLTACDDVCAGDAPAGDATTGDATTGDALAGDAPAAVTEIERSSAAETPECQTCAFLACCAGGEGFDACEGTFPALDALWPREDSAGQGWGDIDWGGDDWGTGGSSIPGEPSVPAGADGSWAFSGLMQGFGCPDTCDDDALCKSVLIGTGGNIEDLKDACDVGCVPDMSPCENLCENVDRPGFLGSAVDVACDACKFSECCAGDDFEACKEHLPAAGGLFPELDWDWDIQFPKWNHTAEWSLNHTWPSLPDWDGIDAASGLSGLVENINSLFDQALGDFSFPVTCNPATCPVDGLCDDGMFVSSVDFEEACKNNTYFACAEGLEEMCAEDCDGEVGFVRAQFCALCGMAECCRDGGEDATFEDCARGAIPQGISEAFEGIGEPFEGIGEVFDDIGESFGNFTDAIGDVFGDVFDQLSNVIEEVVGDSLVPDFCPEADNAEVDDAECQVAGFCDVFTKESRNFNLASVNYGVMCDDNTLFLCGPEGFEDMCADRCDPEDDAPPNAAFCSLCNVATCCKNKDGGTSFEDCALGSSLQDLVPEDSSGNSGVSASGSLDAPVVVVQPDADPGAGASPSEPTETSDAPAGDTSSGSLDGPVDAAGPDADPEEPSEGDSGVPADVFLSEPGGGADAPIEGSPAETEVDVVSPPQASRVESAPQINLGSRVSRTLTFLASASVMALLFVSF